ncbi:hypothetical protein Plhal304r1_c067g0155571 [Plasmopara halstedii]
MYGLTISARARQLFYVCRFHSLRLQLQLILYPDCYTRFSTLMFDQQAPNRESYKAGSSILWG